MTHIGSSESPPRVCVIVLTRNEEDNIAACLNSAQALTDEVFVVDSASEDRTCEVAAALGATVEQRPMDRPFIIADVRNWALDNLPIQAKWALFLDADERLSGDLINEIRSKVESTSYEAFLLAPKFMYQGTWLRRFMGFPNWHPRLMVAAKIRLAGGVWERYEDGVHAGKIETPYLHDVNSKGLEDWIERHTRYAAWEAGQTVQSQPAEAQRRRVYGIARKLGAARPFASLLWRLVIRGGALDGGAVWSYARRQLIFELMIQEAIRDQKRHTGTGLGTE